MSLAGFGAGVLLLFVIAPCCAQLHRSCQRRWEVAAEAPLLTCERLREDTPPYVAVAARTTAQEIITAPVSGADCVCYWADYRSGTYEEWQNGDPRLIWRTETRRQAGRVEIEGGTGTAVVTPGLAERALTGRRGGVVETARDRSRTPNAYNDVHETRVWWVPPGVAMIVIGSVTWDGEVPVMDLPGPTGAGGATTRSHPEAIAHLAARSARWGIATRVSAVAGLVVTSVALGQILLP